MKKIILLLITFLIIPVLSYSQDTTKVYFEYNYSRYTLSKEISLTNLNRNNHSAYLGINQFFASGHYGLYDQFNVGVYLDNWMIQFGLRQNEYTIYTIYEKWFNTSTFRIQFRYNYNTSDTVNKNLYPNTGIIGVGYGYYNNNEVLTVDLLKELEREYALILLTKYQNSLSENIDFVASGSVNNLQDYSLYSAVYISKLKLFVEYYSDFDYTNLQYLNIGMGMRVEF